MVYYRSIKSVIPVESAFKILPCSFMKSHERGEVYALLVMWQVRMRQVYYSLIIS